MAEINQFGNTRAGGFTPDCGRCERELTDAIDGTLPPGEQALFDAHLLTCPECEQMFADAQRGHAWLGMLRSHRPEPPADLVGRILSRTSGLSALELPVAPHADGELPALAALSPGADIALPPLIAFPRPAERPRASLSSLLQTRFAMTAAMAFFSVALTLNLTGVRLSGIRPRDFQPSSLRRDVSDLNAHVLRYYESLRVVYELESRVREMQHSNEPESLAQPQRAQPTHEQQPSKDSGNPPPADGRTRSSGRAHAPTAGRSHGPATVDSLSLPGTQAQPLPPTPTPGRAIPVLLPRTQLAWQKGRLA